MKESSSAFGRFAINLESELLSFSIKDTSTPESLASRTIDMTSSFLAANITSLAEGARREGLLHQPYIANVAIMSRKIQICVTHLIWKDRLACISPNHLGDSAGQQEG